MWQVLLAAAIAGSTGLAAKRFFFNPFSPLSLNPRDHEEADEPHTPPAGIGFLDSPYDQSDGVFRFSSGENADSGVGSGSLPVSRKSSRATTSRLRVRGLNNNNNKKKKNRGFRGDEIDKGSENNRGGVDVWSKRRTTPLCLKKPRTAEKSNAAVAVSASKCVPCSNDRDSSLFRWGLGVGIMYMISAGKREISKLNAGMEETAKAVRELKDELSRRKSIRNLQAPGSAYGPNVDSMKAGGKCRGSLDVKPPCFPLTDDVEYASSVLTEEPEPEVIEMDRLQIELESELQKLNLEEPDEPVEELSGLTDRSQSHQCGGVVASELDKKLSRLLIEQQEGQIEELETELQAVRFKLQHKESELQALKDCVRRLTDFSLSNSLDDEADPNQDQDLPISWNQQNCTGQEPRKPVVGMKRPTDSSCHFQER